jgi:hypothetical protein
MLTGLPVVLKAVLAVLLFVSVYYLSIESV